MSIIYVIKSSVNWVGCLSMESSPKHSPSYTGQNTLIFILITSAFCSLSLVTEHNTVACKFSASLEPCFWIIWIITVTSSALLPREKGPVMFSHHVVYCLPHTKISQRPKRFILHTGHSLHHRCVAKCNWEWLTLFMVWILMQTYASVISKTYKKSCEGTIWQYRVHTEKQFKIKWMNKA